MALLVFYAAAALRPSFESRSWSDISSVLVVLLHLHRLPDKGALLLLLPQAAAAQKGALKKIKK